MILSVKNLAKKYGNIVAVNDISFEVEKGTVFGILGPNGSGKTTTLGILLDVVERNGGSFSWFDQAADENHRNRIGSILETPNFYPHLDAESNLKVNALIKNVSFDRIDEVLSRVNLLERKNSKFRTFSLGMKQRLAIANALLSDPEVLVLDEPTNGLDPQGIVEIRDLINELSSKGKTIIIASHLIDEIEKVCTHVAIMKKGNLLQYGPVSEILVADPRIEIASENLVELEEVLKKQLFVKKIEKRKNMLIISLNRDVEIAEISKILQEKNIYPTHLNQVKKRLEEQFFEIIK
ncbi:MAG: ATP-binding cassette domain-containing protein [Bacteroidota bacterium]